MRWEVRARNWLRVASSSEIPSYVASSIDGVGLEWFMLLRGDFWEHLLLGDCDDRCNESTLERLKAGCTRLEKASSRWARNGTDGLRADSGSDIM